VHADSGGLTRVRAAVRYAVWALLPLAVLASFFAGAVALEAGLGVALLSEGLTRATPLVATFLIGQATLGSLAFSIRCAFIKGWKNPGHDES
jgi:hypothetical protein